MLTKPKQRVKNEIKVLQSSSLLQSVISLLTGSASLVGYHNVVGAAIIKR